MIGPIAWQSDALCAETDLAAFFPEKGESSRAAKAICASCDVAAQCLEYALAMAVPPPGVWGGLNEQERRALKRSVA